MFFFFNDTATTEIYTLSLHDALPISADRRVWIYEACRARRSFGRLADGAYRFRVYAVDAGGYPDPTPVSRRVVVDTDRKSTRLNSSHANISYAVFCLKKKKNTKTSNR